MLNGDRPGTLVFVGAHPDDETFGIGGTLARYTAAGVRAYYICATRGEVGAASAEDMAGFNSTGDMRWAEMAAAARILGLAGVRHLGYRDSGMPGTEDNRHPEALFMAPVEQVTGRVVKHLREIQPDVVITHDPIGGYRHPDHIAVHQATLAAFHAAGDPALYPEAGAPFQPSKLYYNVFPRRMLRVAVKLLPLFGKDPHRFGNNQDVDLVSLAQVEFPIHAAVKLTSRDIQTRDAAAACYRSQMGSGPPQRGLLSLVNRLFGKSDYYMRAYPPPGKSRETDLFQGLA
jgi:N-acetyl-1-D-myo-inositol-2-amino-2-deoxy-alpha-D-glucopyranoside deacetylase